MSKDKILTKDQALEKVKEHLCEKLKDNQEFKSISFDNESWVSNKIGIPVTMRYVHTAKNGNVSTKKLKTYVMPIFDPFTGERYE